MWHRIQPPLTRYLLLPLWNAVNRSPYLRYVSQARQEQWLSKEEINRLQGERLHELLAFANRHCTYYRELFKKNGVNPESVELANLQKLPPLTKTLIREHFDELKSVPFPSKEIVKNATGGSTGQPLTFLVSKDRELHQAAAMTLNYEWMGQQLGDRLAMLWGAPFEATKFQSSKGKIENVLLGRLFLHGFHMTPDDLQSYLHRLRRFRPRVLLGYTSLLTTFATFLKDQQLPLGFRLQAIVSGGEMLYPNQRLLLEEVFQAPVFNRYGGRDSGAVAAECDRHQMHVNHSVAIVETSSDGHILITDLWNMAMPFVRYDTQDVGTLEESTCPCGRKGLVLANIEGRVGDLIRTTSGGVLPGLFFPHLMKDFPWVKHYQILQPSLASIEVRIVKDPRKFQERHVQILTQRIRDVVGPVDVRIQYVEEIPRLPSGKYRFTLSSI